jgi:hypothetical protein
VSTLAPRSFQSRQSVLRNAVVALLVSAFALVGLIGAGRYVWTYWLYRGFSPPSTPTKLVVHRAGRPQTIAVAPTTLVTFDLATVALGGFSDPVYVLLPPGYARDTTARYPTLYLLHGQPGEPQNFLNVGDVQSVEATLVAEKLMKPMILVMPTGSPGFLTDTEWANGIGSGNDWMTLSRATS